MLRLWCQNKSTRIYNIRTLIRDLVCYMQISWEKSQNVIPDMSPTCLNVLKVISRVSTFLCGMLLNRLFAVTDR